MQGCADVLWHTHRPNDIRRCVVHPATEEGFMVGGDVEVDCIGYAIGLCCHRA